HLLGQQLESRFLEPGRDPTRKRYPSIGPLSTPNQTPTVPFAWFRFPRGFGFHAGSVSTRARLIKRVYEFDPLECSECGGAMKIISFIERRQS
ncbi:hypothetical protein N9B31_08815, partial [Mariniblastus sp.]|nr:hypothetical protein [Mariniblastus sp.]